MASSTPDLITFDRSFISHPLSSQQPGQSATDTAQTPNWSHTQPLHGQEANNEICSASGKCQVYSVVWAQGYSV